MRISEVTAKGDLDFMLKAVSPAVDVGAPSFPVAGGPLHGTRLSITLLDAGYPVAQDHLDAGEIPAWRETLCKTIRKRFDKRFSLLQEKRTALILRERPIPLGFAKPLVMGIVNVTPDSFSDGGRFTDVDRAIEHAHALYSAGADIIDIGGESTRPGAKPVWAEEERERVIPVIEGLRGSGAVISIDTRKASVMEVALEAGAHIINDVSALSHDDDAMALAAEADVPVILMHAKGDPATMQKSPHYDHVLGEVFHWLDARIQSCKQAGISRDRLIIDPGIGFGKSVRHNLDLINGLGVFHSLGVPVLLGASRKRFIGALSNEEQADKRLPGSLAVAAQAVMSGVQMLRVHDVEETIQLLRIYQGLADVAQLGQRIAVTDG